MRVREVRLDLAGLDIPVPHMHAIADKEVSSLTVLVAQEHGGDGRAFRRIVARTVNEMDACGSLAHPNRPDARRLKFTVAGSAQSREINLAEHVEGDAVEIGFAAW